MQTLLLVRLRLPHRMIKRYYELHSRPALHSCLDKFLNILPVVTIREGLRVKVCLSGDLALTLPHPHASSWIATPASAG